jgi:predicted transcriptional regulator of viral defense system
MNIHEINLKTVQSFTKDLFGVFTDVDLQMIFPEKFVNSFYYKVRNLEKLGILKRFTRGFYVAEDFNLKCLSQKLCEDSYISFETVLAEHGLIGTYNSNQIRAVKIGRNRKYNYDKYSIEQVSLTKNLFKHFEIINGIKQATPEKAYLDCLYFYMKGMTFSFNVLTDVDTTLLNEKKLKKILSEYKNPQFVCFVENTLALRA